MSSTKQESASQPSAWLFNNPALSDVKIRQMYKDKVCEYHAHKAVLSLESLYFAKAFTGRFMEALQNIIELHDDASERFDCFLQIIYSNQYSEGSHQDELNSASSAVGFIQWPTSMITLRFVILLSNACDVSWLVLEGRKITNPSSWP